MRGNAWSKVSLPVMWLGLTFVLSEKVGMCACINHDKNKLMVVLIVYAIRVRTF